MKSISKQQYESVLKRERKEFKMVEWWWFIIFSCIDENVVST